VVGTVCTVSTSRTYNTLSIRYVKMCRSSTHSLPYRADLDRSFVRSQCVCTDIHTHIHIRGQACMMDQK
jgi:hypothetical protein